MVTAIGYIRFSTKAQDKGSSQDRQEDLITQYCAANGWQITEWIRDLGRSAWKGDHLNGGNLGLFKERIALGKVTSDTVLVIENLDRLSRQDVKRARRWIEEVTEAGIGVAVASLNKVFTEASLSGENIVDLLQYLLEAQRSHKESERKSELIRAHWSRAQKAARDGKLVTSMCPGWLRVVGSKSNTGDTRRFEVVPQRADLVRQIYQWSADGLGAYSIARRLNELSVPSWRHSSSCWDHTTILNTLRSRAVEGEYHPTQQGKATGEVIADYFPRVVDAELVAKARAAMRSRTGNGGRAADTAANLFAGVAKCKCGSAMELRTTKLPNGAWSYLRCRDGARKRGCNQQTFFKYYKLEPAVLDQMLHFALDDRFFIQTDNAALLVRDLAETEKALQLREQQQKRLLSFVAQQDDADEAKQMLAEMRPHVDATRKRVEQLRGQLERARGSVTQEEHLARVKAVRDAIYDEDADAKEQARRLVRDAIRSVVSRAVFDYVDKTVTVIFGDGRFVLRFDGDGKLIGEINLFNQPALQRGSKGLGGDVIWADLKRRGKAA